MNTIFSKVADFASKIMRLFRTSELSHIAYAAIRVTMSYPCYLYYKIFRSSRTFTLEQQTFRYFIHPYNMTWRSERGIEIPIVRKIMEDFRGRDILEVGNVLSYYFTCTHEVVDKYDKSRGVIKQDVVDFTPVRKYDLIVSISTLEHVGWDEYPREPMKVLLAVDKLRNLLAPGGKIIITFGLGYNPVIEELVKKGKIQFTKHLCLKRVSTNEWKQVDCNNVICRTKYGHHSLFATGLFIGIIES